MAVEGTQKLYPIADVSASYNGNFLANERLQTSGLFSSIDGGIFVGDYRTDGTTISDPRTYILPSSVNIGGHYRYKSVVTSPLITPKQSRLFIRAAAPLYSQLDPDQIQPTYKITNIKFEDPSGNLIIKYRDIDVRGDTDFSVDYDNISFTTYLSRPEINNSNLTTQDRNYPILNSNGDYTLTFDIIIEANDAAFNKGFNLGFDDDIPNDDVVVDDDDYLSVGSPISTRRQEVINPATSIRISEIEIFNFGAVNVVNDNYLNLYTDVRSTGERLERFLSPERLLVSDYDTGVNPSVDSVWVSSPDASGDVIYNTTPSGSLSIVSRINNDDDSEFITLDSSSVEDSGKLKLVFSHKTLESLLVYRGGAFKSLGDSFLTAELVNLPPINEFFVVDEVYLRVKAKKAEGSRDYAIDVVGYSDDKLLNITSSVGGFLQNEVGGSGAIPQESGFAPIDSLGLSSESISDKFQFFSREKRLNEGGDHYRLSPNVVTSTDFTEYNIPLKIYPDLDRLGVPVEYGMSSNFEQLHVDIYPLPSGASISSMQLVVKYKPSNGLHLHTAGEPRYNQKSGLQLFPNLRGNNLPPATLNRLSSLENIPHGYDYPNTFHQNYSRRWRCAEGISDSAFYHEEFDDFAFKREFVDSSLLDGYFNFENVSNSIVFSDKYSDSSGIANHDIVRHKNIGWRFNTYSLFSEDTDYTTTDWTSISGYENHELYGKIADAFDNCVRISGDNKIEFGNFDPSEGFAVFVRFTPDISVSGLTYNHFQSGVIFSKYNDDDQLQFLLGYSGGYIYAQAQDDEGDLVTVIDDELYSQFSYPLGVLLTYNDANSRKLKLYVDNEIESHDRWSLHRETSQHKFDINSGSGSVTLGYDSNFGVGFNCFVSDFGFSSSANIVQHDPNLFEKEVNAERFFDAYKIHYFYYPEHINQHHDHHFHDFIDENINDWTFGEFRHTEFQSNQFPTLSRRSGYDFLYFNLKDSGIPYSERSDVSLPSGFNSDEISYHSQIENDFVRINLSDAPDNFYAAAVRINKSLPEGYDFTKDALVVESVFEHVSSGDIVWPDGKTGPKLIVSLYTTAKDPSSYSAQNFGLINRGIHYLENKDYIGLLQTTFDFNSFKDDSEAWSLFPKEKVVDEFNHRYFSRDLDKMFVQYDVVYPSGNSFESTLRIDSLNVKLNNYISKQQDLNENIDFVTMGDAYEFNFLDLVTRPHEESVQDLVLTVQGEPVFPVDPQELFLYTEGVVGIPELDIPLYVAGLNEGGFGSSYDNLFGSAFPNALDLFVSGQFVDNEFLNLHTITATPPILSAESTLSLVCFDTFNDFNISLPIFVRGDEALVERFFVNSSIILQTQVTDITVLTDFVNLHTTNFPTITTLDSSLTNYVESKFAFDSTLVGKKQFLWSGSDYGVGIDIDDNVYASIPVSNEIRGVDLICFGNCDTSGTCIEKGIFTHETQWTEDRCVDGGIFRAKSTYTNPTASGFGDTIGYSGNFYGIRKYEGLVPSAPYFISVKALSGRNDFNIVPPVFEEWEYGTNENVAFSGTKIVSNERQSGSQFGYSVATSKNLAVIGAPKETLYENGSEIPSGGALYVYRRQEEPTITSGVLSSDKTGWYFESKLTLPSGRLLDYPTPFGTVSPLPNLPIPRTQWNVGQEGRELGSSVAAAINTEMSSYGEKNREIIIAGGPRAEFSRTFDSITTNTIQACAVVFADEFNPNDDTVWRNQTIFDQQIHRKIQQNKILYKYYANPPLEIDVKLLVIQPTGAFSVVYYDNFRRKLPNSSEDYLFHTTVQRTNNLTYSQNKEAIDDNMLDTAINLFLDAFPYDENEIHNNIPVTVGFYCDNSRSLNRGAVEPLITNFKNWYREYSFASGLSNVDGVPTSGNVYEFFPTLNQAEDWRLMSNIIFDELLDTGRITNANEQSLFAESFGLDAINTNLTEFNVPPTLGGRVYIFEKESGVWNVIQEIENSSDFKYNGFGHSVAISDDTLNISIGAPYSNEACVTMKYDPTVKEDIYYQLQSWLSYRNGLFLYAGDFDDIISDYNDVKSTINDFSETNKRIQAGKIIYHRLSAKDKFDYRRDENFWSGKGGLPEEYKPSFRFSYDDINYYGDSKWKGYVLGYGLNTSRLGWSSALNQDGSIIAFGCPTDSLNRFDDPDLWYGALGSNVNGLFPSEQYAGSVRVFESRDYHAHDLAVSFSRFGNVGEEDGDLQILDNIFNGNGVPTYRKLEFSEIEIPTNAGLAFITTPSLDAASDEIIQNIKDWLSLGDRTLVLVGNDETFEENGKYRKSNQVVNKILEKLDSRVRLHSAKNEHEALMDSGFCAGNRENILPSYQPKGTRSSYIDFNDQFIGEGVADIRMHFPTHSTRYMPNCSIYNTKCQMPLSHNGDLRAEWGIPYYNSDSKRNSIGGFNWARAFDPNNKPRGAQDWNYSIYNLPDQEPIPLLVAAEYEPAKTIVYPAIPPSSGLFPRSERVVVRLEDLIVEDVSERYYWDVLGAQNLVQTEPQFIIDFENGSLTYEGDMFDPEAENERDPIVQGVADIREFNPVRRSVLAHDRQVICAEEKYITSSDKQYDSQFIMLASVAPESRENLLAGNQDINIQFYTNLVTVNEKDLSKLRKNSYACDVPSVIGLIGGWTDRSSFKDGYSDSFLEELFFESQDIRASVKVFDGPIPSYIDICWIPNTKNSQPSNSDIQNLKNWMELGGKKLILTYDETSSSALAARNISNLLGMNIQPVYLQNSSRFATKFDSFGTATNKYQARGAWQANRPQISSFNHQSSIVKSCSYDASPQAFNIVNNLYPLFEGNHPQNFIPILGSYYYRSLGDKVKDAVIRIEPIFDNEFYDVPAIFEIEGNASVSVPAIVNSGYTVFVNYISEFPEENIPITFACGQLVTDPTPNEDDSEGLRSNTSSINRQSEVKTFTFTGKATSNSLDFRFGVRNGNIGTLQDFNYTPKTHRILSISGVFHPIGRYVKRKTRRIPQFSYFIRELPPEWIITDAGRPERTVNIPEVLRPITNDNSKYCDDICDYHVRNRILPQIFRPSIRSPNYYMFYCDKYEVYRTEGVDGYYLDNTGGSIVSTHSCRNQQIEDGPVVAVQEAEHFSIFRDGSKRSEIVVLGDKSLIQGNCVVDSGGVIRESNLNFIRSLYPSSPPEELAARGGRRYSLQDKIIAPDRSSPVRNFHASGLDGLIRPYSYSIPNRENFVLNMFSSNLSSYDPKLVSREKRSSNDDPRFDTQQFITNIMSNRTLPRWGASGIGIEYVNEFPVVVDRSEYSDAVNGKVPKTLTKLGYDFIDLQHQQKTPELSGFVGDLFGYSISLYNNQLVVGAPFAPFKDETNIPTWSNIANDSSRSGLELSNYGGAGAVYVFENTSSGVDELGNITPWEFKQKLRPNTINAGQDISDYDGSQNENVLGSHSYESGFLFKESMTTDRFGSSLDRDGDMLVIGSPGHDFENLVENVYQSGEFVRKEFDFQFDIPLHNVYDLGSSENRSIYPNSGSAILNRGAVFTYENAIDDWSDKSQKWILKRKVIPQGYNSNNQNSSENDNFGCSVAIDRVDRVDAKYNAFFGSFGHDYGLDSQSPISNEAGSVYSYDAMIRNQPPVQTESGVFLHAKFFSDGFAENNISIYVDKAIHSESNQEVFATGLVFTSKDGELYLEGSGVDINEYGNIENRPFVHSVYGELIQGNFVENGIRLVNIGPEIIQPESSGTIILHTVAPEAAYVYNTLGFHTDSIIERDFDNLNLTNNAGSISGVDDSLSIFTSGQGLMVAPTLILRGQGK